MTEIIKKKRGRPRKIVSDQSVKNKKKCKRPGRTRKPSHSKDKMIKLGKEMVEWVLSNDPLHLSEFYTIHKGILYSEWKALLHLKEFLPYYEKCLKIIGIKYLNSEDKRIKDGVAQRFLRIYFKDLREREDEDFQQKVERELEKRKKEIELEASQRTASTIPPQDVIIDLQNRMMELQAENYKLRNELSAVQTPIEIRQKA